MGAIMERVGGYGVAFCRYEALALRFGLTPCCDYDTLSLQGSGLGLSLHVQAQPQLLPDCLRKLLQVRGRGVYRGQSLTDTDISGLL